MSVTVMKPQESAGETRITQQRLAEVQQLQSYFLYYRTLLKQGSSRPEFKDERNHVRYMLQLYRTQFNKEWKRLRMDLLRRVPVEQGPIRAFLEANTSTRSPRLVLK